MMKMLTTTALALAVALAAPAAAQDRERNLDDLGEPRGGLEDWPLPREDQPLGLDGFGDAARDFIDQFERDIVPMLREMEREIMPLLEDLGRAVGSIDDYGKPEVLPNGDIIIRRNPDAPPYRPGDRIPPLREFDEDDGITL